jgi:hypothetical protein
VKGRGGRFSRAAFGVSAVSGLKQIVSENLISFQDSANICLSW